jgi:hypothetical protein
MNIYTIRANHKSIELRAAVDAANRELSDSGDSINYDNVKREYMDLLEKFGVNSVFIDEESVNQDEE